MKSLTNPQQRALQRAMGALNKSVAVWVPYDCERGPYGHFFTQKRTAFSLARLGLVEIRRYSKTDGWYKVTLAGIVAWTAIEQKRKKAAAR